MSGGDGEELPRPVSTFEQCGFDDVLLAALKKHQLEKPSPIQATAIPGEERGRASPSHRRVWSLLWSRECPVLRSRRVVNCPEVGLQGLIRLLLTLVPRFPLSHFFLPPFPTFLPPFPQFCPRNLRTCSACRTPAVALSGFDIIGVAKTGSGKTAAYVLPMAVHIMDQPLLGRGEGPIALVLCPTRELALQVHKEASRFLSPYSMAVVAGVGGMDKKEQVMGLKHGAEVLIGTPGRVIDLAGPKDRACTLRRVTYLVLDEADRMLDLGFEPQVQSICKNVRPDRQTLMFRFGCTPMKRRLDIAHRSVLALRVSLAWMDVPGRV